jgi:hypothetical protein
MMWDVNMTIILVSQNQFLHHQSNQRLFSLEVVQWGYSSEWCSDSREKPSLKVCGIITDKIVPLDFW